MGRPVNFYATAGLAEPTTSDLTVRVHTEDKMNGDLAGTNLSYAETAERPPTVVFWNDQLTAAGVALDRGNYIILSASEGYHVESVNPPDGQSTTCEVTPLSTSELAPLTAPETS